MLTNAGLGARLMGLEADAAAVITAPNFIAVRMASSRVNIPTHLGRKIRLNIIQEAHIEGYSSSRELSCRNSDRSINLISSETVPWILSLHLA